MRVKGRRGVTLLEMLVALAIAGAVVTTARLVLEALADNAQLVVERAAANDAEANAERLLRRLIATLEVGTDNARRFAGEERAARFTSWCDVPHGWQERCTITLAIDRDGAEPVLAASLSTGELFMLRRAVGDATLRYLGDAARGGRWFRSWGDGITAPLAIGIVLDGDTLIYRIGERG